MYKASKLSEAVRELGEVITVRERIEASKAARFWVSVGFLDDERTDDDCELGAAEGCWIGRNALHELLVKIETERGEKAHRLIHGFISTDETWERERK